jgi:glycosyltransferase involved in cell wall biosynthesis
MISVIVPVRNGESYLEESLPAVRRSENHDFELIVVDDMSTDGSTEIADRYADLVVRLERPGGPAAARNAGAAASRGEILLFVDADVWIAPDTISKVAEILNGDRNLGAAFGSYDDHPRHEDFFSLFKNLFHHYIHQNAKEEAVTFWSGCGAIRKTVFIEAGGFSQSYTAASIEDVELGYRLREKGIGIRLIKNLQVTHLKKWRAGNLLKTDIMQRAVPWARLSRKKGLPLDLNFKRADRASGVMIFSLFLSLLLGGFWKPLFPAAAVLALALLWTNRKLYVFFLKRRGFGFAFRAVLFHWFYLLYSSAVFATLSTGALLRRTVRALRPASLSRRK